MKANASVGVASSSIVGLFTTLVFAIVASGCAAEARIGEATDSERYDREVVSCIENMKKAVRAPLTDAPDFSTLHEVTAWAGKRLPVEIRHNLADAGRAIVQTQQRTVGKGNQDSYFSDIPTLSALMFGQSTEHLDGVSTCQMSRGSGGTARQVLLDQINVGLNIRDNKIFERFKQLGVDDSHFSGQLILYGVIFDLGGVTWTDEQISGLVKYRPNYN